MPIIHIKGRDKDNVDAKDYCFILENEQQRRQYKGHLTATEALLSNMDPRILNFLHEENERHQYIIPLCDALSYIGQQKADRFGEEYAPDEMTDRVGAKICSIIDSNDDGELISREISKIKDELMTLTGMVEIDLPEGGSVLMSHTPTDDEINKSFGDTPDDVFRPSILTMKFVD
jgi:hypothetical protein